MDARKTLEEFARDSLTGHGVREAIRHVLDELDAAEKALADYLANAVNIETAEAAGVRENETADALVTRLAAERDALRAELAEAQLALADCRHAIELRAADMLALRAEMATLTAELAEEHGAQEDADAECSKCPEYVRPKWLVESLARAETPATINPPPAESSAPREQLSREESEGELHEAIYQRDKEIESLRVQVAALADATTARAEGYAAGLEAGAALVDDWAMPSDRASLAGAIRSLESRPAGGR